MIRLSKQLSFWAIGLAGSLVIASQTGILRLTGKVGDVRKYKMIAVMDLGGISAKVTGDVTEKITKIDSQGNETIESTHTNSVIELPDQKVKEEDKAPLVEVYRPDGSLAELHGENSGNAWRLETLTSAKLPDSTIAKEKTWTWEVPANKDNGIVKSTVVFRVLGDETVAAIDCWKISRTIRELEGASPASAEGTVWISKQDGFVVKQSDKWTNAPIPNSPGQVNGTISLELQP